MENYRFVEFVTDAKIDAKKEYFVYRREMKGRLKGASEEAHKRHRGMLEYLKEFTGDIEPVDVEEMTFKSRYNKKLEKDIISLIESGEYLPNNYYKFTLSWACNLSPL